MLRRQYTGVMIGIRREGSDDMLWTTGDHRILCRSRLLGFGAGRSWRHIAHGHFARARSLRRKMTAAEKALWVLLRREALGVKFRRQHPIGPYIADFYSCETGLVIEADGPVHHSPEAMAYDGRRDHYMRSMGLRVIRFSNESILQHPDVVCRKIMEALDETRPSDVNGRQWRRADTLVAGDFLFVGPNMWPHVVVEVRAEESEEVVYDLEVEEAQSFITSICAVHDCSGGTSLGVC